MEQDPTAAGIDLSSAYLLCSKVEIMKMWQILAETIKNKAR